MTDYIALALADQEERENSETAELLLEQHRAAGVRRGKAREQGMEVPASAAAGGGTAWGGSGPAAGARAEGETDGRDTRNQNGGLAELTDGQIRGWLVAAEAAAPTGAVGWPEVTGAVFLGRRSAGEGLYRRLRQAQTAAEYRPSRTGAVLLPAEGRNGSVQGLAELDRAFQRDARRYDGGFELY